MSSLTYPVPIPAGCSQRLVPVAEFRAGSFARQGGPALPSEQAGDQALDLHHYLVEHPPSTFIFRVEGRHLEGIGIQAGDLVPIDRSLAPQSGHLVLAIVDGDFALGILRCVGAAYELHGATAPLCCQGGAPLRVVGVARGMVRKLL